MDQDFDSLSNLAQPKILVSPKNKALNLPTCRFDILLKNAHWEQTRSQQEEEMPSTHNFEL